MMPSFYGRLRSEAYDIDTDVHKVTDFYIAQWQKLGSPNPALEVMSGTGLHLIPFIQAGARMDGLDLSPHMLAVCRHKLQVQGLQANLYEQPLQTMALPERYSFICIPDRSFGHLYKLDVAQSALKRIRERLLPGGWFMFDLLCPAQMSRFGKPGQADFEVVDRPDGSTIFSTGVWGDIEDGRVIRNWNKYERYVEGKLVEIETFDYRERVYERAEVETMLRAAGFDEMIVLKAHEDAPPEENQGFVFIARGVS